MEFNSKCLWLNKQLFHLFYIFCRFTLLTHSLNHSYVCIMLLKLGKGRKIILCPNLYKVSGNKSPGQCSLEATIWKFSLEEYLTKNNNQSKTINLFWRFFLTRAVLLWFYLSSSSVIQICPFINLYSHLRLASSGFNYAKKKFSISVLIWSFFLDSGLVWLNQNKKKIHKATKQ